MRIAIVDDLETERAQLKTRLARQLRLCGAEAELLEFESGESFLAAEKEQSSVSRIGTVFSHPLGQKVSTCGTPQIRRHRGGLGMGAFLPLYSVYSDNSTLSRKKQFFQKLLHFPSSYVCRLIFGVECYMWALFVIPDYLRLL